MALACFAELCVKLQDSSVQTTPSFTSWTNKNEPFCILYKLWGKYLKQKPHQTEWKEDVGIWVDSLITSAVEKSNFCVLKDDDDDDDDNDLWHHWFHEIMELNHQIKWKYLSTVLYCPILEPASSLYDRETKIIIMFYFDVLLLLKFSLPNIHYSQRAYDNAYRR